MAENHPDFRVFIEDIYSRLKVSNDTDPDGHDEHHDDGNFFAMITLGVMGFFFLLIILYITIKDRCCCRCCCPKSSQRDMQSAGLINGDGEDSADGSVALQPSSSFVRTSSVVGVNHTTKPTSSRNNATNDSNNSYIVYDANTGTQSKPVGYLPPTYQ